jgi:hypothetical protein
MFETIDNAALVANAEPEIADACLADRVITSVGRARTSTHHSSATPDAPVVDRRTSARHDRCGLPDARLRSGQALALLNLSQGGLQAVSDSRLLPGTALEVTLQSGDDARWTVPALVLRCQCQVSPLDDGRLRFLAALSFLEPCSWSPPDAAPPR